jgi:hypothetical protein
LHQRRWHPSTAQSARLQHNKDSVVIGNRIDRIDSGPDRSIGCTIGINTIIFAVIDSAPFGVIYVCWIR